MPESEQKPFIEEKPAEPVSSAPVADAAAAQATVPAPEAAAAIEAETEPELKGDANAKTEPVGKAEAQVNPEAEVKAESEQPAPAPALEPTSAAGAPSGPAWPEFSADHPLSRLLADLPKILGETGYNELYGIQLDPAGPFHTKLILQKFLRANANDVAKAKDQLLDTLRWRKEFKPLDAKAETFSKERFGTLGYVTVLDKVPGSENKKEIATFNVYGSVKDNKATFEDLEGFLRWRVALMELGLEKLKLSEATAPIPDYGKGADPYQGYQIHDYLNVSFIRMDPYAKAASKKTIETFSRYYPETLSRKFFVNVPVVMGWMFNAMKLVLPKETVRKFTVLSYGNELAKELGPEVPEAYGGKGGDLATSAEVLKME